MKMKQMKQMKEIKMTYKLPLPWYAFFRQSKKGKQFLY